jgi:hypothetical protein
MTVLSRSIENGCQFFEVGLVRVRLSGVRSRVTHQGLQRDEVAAGLPNEAVGETMSELMRERGRTPARRQTRVTILPSACGLAGCFGSSAVLRDPQLNLDHEDVIVQVWRQ